MSLAVLDRRTEKDVAHGTASDRASDFNIILTLGHGRLFSLLRIIGNIFQDFNSQHFEEKIQFTVYVERSDSILESKNKVGLLKMDAQGFECKIQILCKIWKIWKA